MSTIPVILCGVSKVMGGRVTPRLMPELEVIQFITSPERAITEIAQLQAGQAPTPDPDDVGTHDFSRVPQAVLFGRGFDGPTVQGIYQACGGAASRLVWLRAEDEDVAKVLAKPPSAGVEGQLDGYAAKIADVIKETVGKIKEEGGWGRGGVFTYGGM